MTPTRIEKMFRAFADPTRLRLLSPLQDGEHCVSDLIEILKEPQAKVSHHLIYLGAAGLVECRRQGLWSFYRLSPPRSAFHRKLLECLGECLNGVPGLAADKRRASKLRGSGGCYPVVIRERANRCSRASGCGKA